MEAFYALLSSLSAEPETFGARWGEFFALLCEAGYADNFAGCLTGLALYDDNLFARTCASIDARPLPERVRAAVERDLRVLCDVAQLTPDDLVDAYGDRARLGCLGRSLPRWGTGERIRELQGPPAECMQKMAAFYARNGCGLYARYAAFVWRGGELEPVLSPDPVKLESLKEYKPQQALVLQNTADFVEGLPANNCLLYGDRGTGKSSTVKALLHRFRDKGLRMVEVKREALHEIPALLEALSRLPLRFILFLDDLSFADHGESFTALKAVLEGGLTVRPDNALIYATSNRRHLVRETFSDRAGDELHRSDSLHESLSLADRFGVSVCFSSPDREEYLKIVAGIAADHRLKLEQSVRDAEAEVWALGRGGRSPRAARQYIDFAKARESRLRLNPSDGQVR